ncbi:MAG TPA: TonB-dependent receptor, partial [Bryobacteraceae bacterium]
MIRDARVTGTARYGAVLLLILAIPSLIWAQFDTGTILGAVRDPSGAVIPGVTITLRNTQTSITATAQTDEQGNYQFGNLRIGNYEVSAEKTGFAKSVVPSIQLVVNARQRADIVLQVGGVTDKVVVTGSVALLETDSSEKGQVVDGEQIESLPLNGRSYADLALLAPGVSESNQNDIAISGTGREGSFNVNGLRNTFNNFQLDGVDNNQYGTSNQGFSNQVISPSPDSVAEFKVQTNSYSAEYGRSGGAVINAAYRSGTNEFHGSLWDFTRNTALNAVGFFKPAGGVKPSLNRHQFGFTFGGPIRHDRTFFFADYEGFRQSQKTLTYSTIPTADQRNGILTVPVTDPFTGATYAGGTPIPMSDFARKVLNDLPEPNVPGVTSSNYQKAVANRSVYDKFNLKIDHKISDALSTFVRVSQGKNNAFQAPNISGPSGGNQNGVVNVMAQQLVLGATGVVNSRSVLEVRLGISRTKAGKNPPYIGGPSMRELYGITGLPEDRTLTGGLTPQSITGYTQLGRQSTNPQFQNPTDINPRASYTWNAGRQTLKFGLEFAAINVDVNDTNPNYGLDSYTSQFSRPAGRASSNLYNLADFMLGLRSQYGFGTRVVAPMRRRSYYGYIQDDIKATSRLTLNIGLRYEFVTPYYAVGDKMSNFDPATSQIVTAQGGSLFERSLVHPDYNDFAPRFGFAYRLADKTVLRGGYGIGFIHFNRLASAELLATNYPFVTRATVTQSTTGTVNGQTVTLPLCTGSVYQDGCFRTTQMGYPTDLPNDVVLHVPSDIRSGYVQNWQFAVQRQVGRQTVVEAAYAGNHAVKLVLLADLNQARPPLAGENVNATLDARRPYQGFGTISTVLPAGFSNYHSLQIKVEHRASRSLNLLNSFTWSKGLDNASQVLEEPSGSTGTPQDIYNVNADKGISGYDVPILNVTSAVWNLPVGKGRRFGGNLPGVLEQFVGGWQI